MGDQNSTYGLALTPGGVSGWCHGLAVILAGIDWMCFDHTPYYGYTHSWESSDLFIRGPYWLSSTEPWFDCTTK
jgi:hypothetical protein